MNNILQKIANILTLNVDNISDVGLLNGQMGIVIFYYNYSRISQNKLYSDIADELFDSVYKKVNSLKDVSFDKGVIGIAWGIRYLIRNKFVEGNPDEVLPEIEDVLFKQYINDSQSQIPLSAMGMYIHSMIIDGADVDKIDHLIFTILNKYDYYFLGLSNKSKPFTYINSSLFVLSILRKFPQYKARAEKVVYKVLLYLSTLENFSQESTSDLKILCKILLSIDIPSEEKNLIMDKLVNICGFGNINETIEYLWQSFMYFPDEIVSIESDDIDVFLDKNYYFLPKEDTLSIYKGLASIGLNLINIQLSKDNITFRNEEI